jgi:glycosyltransferase involved in cell wall biosynthesis
MTRRQHVVVMVTTSYPRFAGDGVGSFIEPIAKGVAARGHDVHLVAPWHPRLTRGAREDGVTFHFYRYAPVRSMNVFGYAEGMAADTHLRLAAWSALPAALLAGWFKAMRVAHKTRATVVHAHWVIPNGVMAALAAGARPVVVSLHGTDVFVAERHRLIGHAARAVFRRAGWVTACSEDLRTRAIALGADHARTETMPYGVDAERFAPSPDTRARLRSEWSLGEAPVVFAAGRLVTKKGFESLIDAAQQLAPRFPRLRVLIAGDGDLREPLARLASSTSGVVTLLGDRSQDEIASLAAAADVIAVPSVHDEAGNVDGLPNFALEALASATPVVATRVGGLPDAIADGITGLLVPERAPIQLADAIGRLLADPHTARDMGAAARARVMRDFGWPRVAERLEHAYDAAAERPVGVSRD